MRDTRSILRHRTLLDLVEQLDSARAIIGRADIDDRDVIVHVLALAHNALREAADFLARLPAGAGTGCWSWVPTRSARHSLQRCPFGRNSGRGT